MATLTEIQTFCKRVGWRDTTSAGDTALTDFINDTIEMLALARRWPYFEATGYISLAAPYTTGTVSINQDATAVTGSGTTFATGMAGQEIYFSDDSGRVYQVSAYGGTTSLTLASALLGSNISGGTYSLRYVRYAAPSDWGAHGVFWFEDGREVSWSDMTLDEWHRERMLHRGTSSVPTDILMTYVSGTGYFFVHPAPSARAMIRYTYQRVPTRLSAGSSAADIPTWWHGLLFDALRVRLASDDMDAGMTALQDRQLQRQIDTMFERQKMTGPVPVTAGEGGPMRVGLNGVGALMNFPDD